MWCSAAPATSLSDPVSSLPFQVDMTGAIRSMNEIVKYCAEAKVTVIHNFDFDFVLGS